MSEHRFPPGSGRPPGRPGSPGEPELREIVVDELMRIDERPRAALIAVLARGETDERIVIDRVIAACVQDRPVSIPQSVAAQLLAKERMGVAGEDGNIVGGVSIPPVPLDEHLTPHELAGLHEEAACAREELSEATNDLKAAEFARDRFAEREIPPQPAAAVAEARRSLFLAYLIVALEVTFLAAAATATGLLPEGALGLPDPVIALAGSLAVIVALQAAWRTALGGTAISGSWFLRVAALVLVLLAVGAIVAVRAGASLPISMLQDHPGLFSAAPLALVVAAVLLLSYETAACFAAARQGREQAKQAETPYQEHLAEAARHAQAIADAEARRADLKLRIEAPQKALSAAHQRIYRRETQLLTERTRWTRWAEVTIRLARDLLPAYLRLPPWERSWALNEVSKRTPTDLFVHPNDVNKE